MTVLQIIATTIFIGGYILSSLEHEFKLNKAAIALAIGGFLWLLVALFGHIEGIDHILTETSAEIFEIVMFLLSAMSLVEILVHYRLFDIVRGKIFEFGLSEQKQFLVIALLAFIFSGAIDNLTTTIVMIQIARKFFKGENLLRAGAMIVIAANAGGAFSPIGDVTTIMLWLAGKFDTLQLISQGFLPSLVLFGVAVTIMYRQITNSSYDATKEIVTTLRKSEKIIMALVFISFTLPIMMSFISLPPFLGLALGLGVVWIAVDLLKSVAPNETHLSASIEKFISQTDIPALKFFIGILLAVSALNSLGILELLSSTIFGHDPTVTRMIIGNSTLGMISAVLDNVPLTAITIKALHTSISELWVLLALTVGTGGSLLIIGSASGVIAMGLIEGLTSKKYFQIAFIPAFVGYVAAIATWLIQYLIFFS